MKNYIGKQIRNVAVLGHSGCGKSTLVEAILNTAEVTKRMGRIEEGNTVSDYEQEEIKRKVSISTSIIPVEWRDTKINFLDTPGYFDFIGEVKQALRVSDIALIVVSAKSGVEVGTEKAWEYAEELGIPKIFFVNEMDDDNADMDKVVNELKAKFGKSIAPLQVPFKENGKFIGFVNAVKKEGRKFVNGRTQPCDIPNGMEDDVIIMNAMIQEAVAETDDKLMEKFFEEQEFTAVEIERGIKDGLLTGIVTPVLCGSAFFRIGMRVLLNSIDDFVPSSEEICKTVKATSLNDKSEIEIKCEDAAKTSAFVFKTIADPYVGRLSLFRVYSGVLKKDSLLYNPNSESTEKVGHLYVMRGKEQIEVNELHTGDIGAIAKLAHTRTGDTLTTKENPIEYKRIEYPESLLSMAVMPKAKGDEDKIAQAFSKLLEEDRTLKFIINKETKQSIIYGVGDNQLDILVNKLKSKYKLDVELIVPIVPYREMIKGKVKVQGKYKKQSGGHGQYGDVWIEFEPSQDQSIPYIFEERIFGGSVPRQYFPAVEKGIQESVKAGPIAGYPVVGIKATLLDGSYHAVDSSEMAFKMATIMAFKDGFMKAKPTILEPIAKAVITVPDDYTGDIMGDMNKRRGRILGMEKIKEKQNIVVEVPQAEMYKYATELRSITQGRGIFTMEFIRYEEAPKDIQEKVIAKRKAEMEKNK